MAKQTLVAHYQNVLVLLSLSELTYGLSLQHNAEAVKCDPLLSEQLKYAARSALGKMSTEAANYQHEIPVLMSGAGHDSMAMSHLTKVKHLNLKLNKMNPCLLSVFLFFFPIC